MPRIAVIGDVHANSSSLTSALAAIRNYSDNNRVAIDKLIFIGDLLTYGVDVRGTLNLLQEASAKYDTCIILGNHDQLYLDLICKGASNYYSKLPDWIKESVDYTLSCVEHNYFLSIPFEFSFAWSQLYFAHANSSAILDGEPDWSYINSLSDHSTNLSTLMSRNYAIGVFGHTHRKRLFLSEQGGLTGTFLDLDSNCSWVLDLSGGQSAIINVGSIGQPRSAKDLRPTFLLLELSNSDQIEQLQVSFVSYDYDLFNHIDSINRTAFSDEVKSRLVSFFYPN